MELTHPDVIAFIKACSAEGSDSFIITNKMPGPDDVRRFASFLDGRTLVLTGRRTPERTCENVIYADVGEAADEAFAERLKKDRVTEILLPFYECADVLEYGYRTSYSFLGDLRASSDLRFHITGVSPNETADDGVYSLLGSKKFIVAGQKIESVFTGVKASDDEEKCGIVLSQCVKSPFMKTIVLFSTRRQADEFSLKLYKRGVKCAVAHGGTAKEQAKLSLESFLSGETSILLSTKYLIPSCGVIKADRLIYCGLPYGVSHAKRCICLSKSGRMDVVFCEDDIALAQSLTASYAEALGIDDPGFTEKRKSMLDEFLNALQY
ncbi:MAG: hypothetical protein IJS90_04860 [Clostridia bacterium]|nr:hypothetical protein [Clostridia bacterium]